MCIRVSMHISPSGLSRMPTTAMLSYLCPSTLQLLSFLPPVPLHPRPRRLSFSLLLSMSLLSLCLYVYICMYMYTYTDCKYDTKNLDKQRAHMSFVLCLTPSTCGAASLASGILFQTDISESGSCANFWRIPSTINRILLLAS